MKDKIVIVGGHGHVGRIITQKLAVMYQDKLILAGRDLERLTSFKRKADLAIGTMVFDINQPPLAEQFVDISLVLVCIDQQTPDFALFCQKMGIDYLDVSANTDFYHKLAAQPFQSETGIVYSVGIAPGVTNLMAAKLADEMADFDEMVIKVILGLADQHGEAAIDWTLTHLRESYHVKGQSELVNAFEEKAVLELPQKRIPAYSFNFSDQHSLTNRWPSKKIRTYLGFDVPWVTQLFNRLYRLKLLKLIERPVIKSLAKGWMNKGVIGTDVFYVQVTAVRKDTGEKIQLTVTGHDEALATGKVAAYVAEKVYQSDVKGFVQIEDLCTFNELLVAVPELTLLSS